MSPTLDDLIPEGLFVGTSLILREGSRFLYGMRPARREGDRLVVELTGIGGSMEQDDASYVAGVLREAQEEMGCGVQLVAVPQTLVVRAQDQVERVTLADPERPAALVFRHHRTPPHQPWHEQNAGRGCLIVYLAHLAGTPSPARELPWLIWLSPEQVLHTARNDVPLGELLAAGAQILLGEAGPPPPASWVRLTDSQEALALALGDGLPAFYRSLP